MNDYDLLKDDVYTLRTEGDGLRITKFTKDLNPVVFYHLKPNGDFGYTCNCPQSNRGACKHLDIVDAFMTYPERIDKGWFFCQQAGDWFPPVERSYIEPLPPGDDGVKDPSLAPSVTPEVEVEPPKPPSGVMNFSRRGL